MRIKMLVTDCPTHLASYISTPAFETVAREKKIGKIKTKRQIRMMRNQKDHSFFKWRI